MRPACFFFESMSGRNPTKIRHYKNYKSIFQEYYEFPQDEFGNSYQAGVFFAFEGAGLGFRRGNKILDNMSKFVGHRLV